LKKIKNFDTVIYYDFNQEYLYLYSFDIMKDNNKFYQIIYNQNINIINYS